VADDSFGFAAKALALRNMVGKLPQTLPSWRELNIQIEKLRGKAEEFEKEFPWHLAMVMPEGRLRKKKGPYLRRLALQGKRVDKLLWKLLREFALQEAPGIGKRGKERLNKFCQKMVEMINTNIYKATQQLRLEGRAELKSLKGLMPVPKK